MDWKYKHFAQEVVFQAKPETVHAAVRAFAGAWLADWKVSETLDGIEAKGRSGGHIATAKFRIEPTPGGGTKVAVALQVERASYLGFVLADSGGYYNQQIYKWLQAVSWRIQERLTPATQSEDQPGQALPAEPPIPEPSRGRTPLMGCLIVFVLLPFCLWAAAALVGLLTGTLYIPGRRNFGITIHGPLARILSVIMMGLFGWMVLRVLRPKKRDRGSGWIPPRHNRG
jgi:hypothetical protein